MKAKVLAALLLACSALPALASDWAPVFGQALPAVAQMSQEERRALRERWERSSPEERARLRKDFQERLRRVPGGEFANQGMEVGERMTNPWRDGGYGEGYERRHREDDDRDDSRRDDRRDRYEQRSRDRR